jgi:acyl carrier protein phosphodiesterase
MYYFSQGYHTNYNCTFGITKMNFLAHIYLSGSEHEILIGNFIADSIRGKQFDAYQNSIQQGILLHREIDEYTDSHPVVLECVEKLKVTQGRYASVVIDILFDHYLARNWNRYSQEDLATHIDYVYELMQSNLSILPAKFQKMLPYMIEDNWLWQYQFKEGISKAFEGIARRASFDSNMAETMNYIADDHDYYESQFHLFFADMIQFVNEKGIEISVPNN